MLWKVDLLWMGSIAVIERLYRKNNLAGDPVYKILIVCKNKTDIRMLDLLKTSLSGMIQGRDTVEVCKTENVCQKLVSN